MWEQLKVTQIGDEHVSCQQRGHQDYARDI